MTADSPRFVRSWPRVIVHIDGDAFFASCEQAIHPEYRGKPVVTGKERGIVAAASYEAKARGVKRGVALWDVKKLCPDAIIVPSDYETYSLFSKRMFEIMRRYTSLVEEYSIDEAFAEITGLRRIHRGSYESIGRRMKEAIESELGIGVSVGVSTTKTLAKIGSKHRKPSGLTMIPGRKTREFLKEMPLEKVWNIGPSTTAYCRQFGIETAGQFADRGEVFIRKNFNKPQIETWMELNNISIYPVTTELKNRYLSVSKTKTFTPPSDSRDYIFAQLLKNVENACIKARRHRLVARGIVLYLRTQTYRHTGIEADFSRPTAYPLEMSDIIEASFEEIFRPKTLYRATGAVLIGLAPEDNIQPSLFEPPLRLHKLRRLYEALDTLSAKMGKHAVHLAGSDAAHHLPQHVRDRGDVPIRKLSRLKGETKRKHLSIPLLLSSKKG